MFRSSMKIPEVDIHGTLLVPAGVDGAEEASPSVLNLRPAHECVTRRIDVVTVALTRIAAVVTIGARVPDFDARAGDWCAIGRIHHDEAQSQWRPGMALGDVAALQFGIEVKWSRDRRGK